jgi:hypothetical protein
MIALRAPRVRMARACRPTAIKSHPRTHIKSSRERRFYDYPLQREEDEAFNTQLDSDFLRLLNFNALRMCVVVDLRSKV